MSTIERIWMNEIAGLGCLNHPGTPAVLHHIREGQGLAQRAGNFLVIPLCPECHTGSLSIHHSKRQFEKLYGNELDLLDETLSKLSNKIFK